MNVELLKSVREAILEEPLRIDMATWADVSHEAPCGTVGCIYGWAQALSTGLRSYDLAEYVKDHLTVRQPTGIMAPDDNPLDLTPEQAKRLYYAEHWPQEYQDMEWEEVPQNPEYAQIVANRIDHFIATEGRE